MGFVVYKISYVIFSKTISYILNIVIAKICCPIRKYG